MQYVEGHYEQASRIRYYGQLPRNVRRDCEQSFDASGQKVVIDVVRGEADFSSDGLSVVESDGRPEFLTERLNLNPSHKPLDLSKYKEPAHEAVANLMFDIGSLYQFTKRWGLLDCDAGPKVRTFHVQRKHLEPYVNILRRAWRGEATALKMIASDITARVDVSPIGIEIAVSDLWTLVRLLFLRDRAAGRAQVCENPDCLSPYFIQSRRGQTFCSHRCAVLINVRRFRERAADRHSGTKPEGQTNDLQARKLNGGGAGRRPKVKQKEAVKYAERR